MVKLTVRRRVGGCAMATAPEFQPSDCCISLVFSPLNHFAVAATDRISGAILDPKIKSPLGAGSNFWQPEQGKVMPLHRQSAARAVACWRNCIPGRMSRHCWRRWIGASRPPRQLPEPEVLEEYENVIPNVQPHSLVSLQRY